MYYPATWRYRRGSWDGHIPKIHLAHERGKGRISTGTKRCWAGTSGGTWDKNKII